MSRQFLVSAVVMSILALLSGGIIHGALLAGDYAQLPGLMRPAGEATGYFHWNILAHVSVGVAMTWIYRKGVDPAQPWLMQGVRFGLAVMFLFIVPMFLIYYAVSPYPGMLVAKQIAFELPANILLGIAVAFLNRPAAPAAA